MSYLIQTTGGAYRANQEIPESSWRDRSRHISLGSAIAAWRRLGAAAHNCSSNYAYHGRIVEATREGRREVTAEEIRETEDALRNAQEDRAYARDLARRRARGQF